MRMLPAASGRRCCFLAHACNGKRFVYAICADMHGYVRMDRWVEYGHGMQHVARPDVLVRAMPDAAGEGHWSLFNDFSCVRKCNKWPGARVATHPAVKTARFGCGVRQRAWSLAALPEGLLLQKQLLPCCQCSPGRQPVFIPYSVFRALRLAATAFAKQGARCEDFEQALGREKAVSLHARARAVPGRTSIRSPACQRLRPLRQWAARRRCRPGPTA